MRFSVIIPVYNCVSSLQRCVDSILSQSFGDFELLLIDDGSTDGSQALCDRLAETDSRIRVVHQRNGGTSSARNTGIELAKGEYIAFMDNDDVWFHDEVLSKLDSCISASTSDLICFRTADCWIGDDGPSGKQPPTPELAGSYFDRMSSLIRSSLYTPAVWSRVVKTELVRSHDIRFPVGKRNEDVDFSCKLLRYAESVDFVDDVFYLWMRGSSTSQSSKATTERIADDLQQIVIANADFALGLEEDRRRTIEEFLCFPYAVWMTYAYVYEKDDLAKHWSTMKEYSYLLRAEGDVRANMVRKTASILGTTAAFRIARAISAARDRGK